VLPYAQPHQLRVHHASHPRFRGLATGPPAPLAFDPSKLERAAPAQATLGAAMDRLQPEVASLPVMDLEGRPHALSELWADRPAVLVFLRHFG
jgi:hypothetical protein